MGCKDKYNLSQDANDIFPQKDNLKTYLYVFNFLLNF